MQRSSTTIGIQYMDDVGVYIRQIYNERFFIQVQIFFPQKTTYNI